MEKINLIGALIGFLLIMFGVILIYDARKYANKWFSFHDKNEGSKWFKIGGLLFVILGIIALYLMGIK